MGNKSFGQWLETILDGGESTVRVTRVVHDQQTHRAPDYVPRPEDLIEFVDARVSCGVAEGETHAANCEARMFDAGVQARRHECDDPTCIVKKGDLLRALAVDTKEISLSSDEYQHLRLILLCHFTEASAIHMRLLQSKHGARQHLRGLTVPAADERIAALGQEIARTRKLIEVLDRASR